MNFKYTFLCRVRHKPFHVSWLDMSFSLIHNRVETSFPATCVFTRERSVGSLTLPYQITDLYSHRSPLFQSLSSIYRGTKLSMTDILFCGHVSFAETIFICHSLTLSFLHEGHPDIKFSRYHCFTSCLSMFIIIHSCFTVFIILS